MKTILVITDNAAFAEAVQAALGTDFHHVICQPDLHLNDPLASADQLDACIFDADLKSTLPIRKLESLTPLITHCPFLVYSQTKQLEWEEQAYVLGVMHILAKPVSANILNSILSNIWSQRTNRKVQHASAPSPRPFIEPPRYEPSSGVHQKTLETLRNFSALLPHGLSIEALLKQFLLLVRETVSVNRACIFLKPSPESLSEISNVREQRKLKSACSLGLQPGLSQQTVLSLDSGVGGMVAREGRIIRRDYEMVQSDPQSRREFEILGADVALPILDRETLMGVAFFDRQLTGASLGSEELNLIFYMLEGLGMAIKNVWLHQEVSTSRELLGEILGELKSGCVVVGSDLTVLHANSAARIFLGEEAAAKRNLNFRDIPQHLGSKIYEVLQGGKAPQPFRHEPASKPGRIFQISVTPFGMGESSSPRAALMLVEDCTESEKLRQIEMEASNLRMVRTMAERLAHEIGNAIVPISTHQQLLTENIDDPEFRASLEVAMEDGVKRIGRLGQQMLFLAQDRPRSSESIAVPKLIEEAFREAQKNHGEQPVVLQYDTGGKQLVLNGDKAGLKHALAEIMLNALQANPPSPKVRVDTSESADNSGMQWLKIQVQDSGTGFTAEASQKAPDPFFTTRNVGLGLGLTVSRKIIEMHHGRIEISSPDAGQAGLVTITLPMDGN